MAYYSYKQHFGASSDTPKNALSSVVLQGNTSKYRILQPVEEVNYYDITYLAQDMRTGQEVVIKEYMPLYCAISHPDTHERVPINEQETKNFEWSKQLFLLEANLYKELDYPGIIKVTDVFTAMGTAYYAVPCAGVFDSPPIKCPPPTAITEAWLAPVLRKVLEALAYLHSHTLLHSDITPNNIIITATGTPVLINFGNARHRISKTIGPVDKIILNDYKAPEHHQTTGKLGPWSDLYSLGATCYHMITGKNARCFESFPSLESITELHRRFSRSFLQSIDKAMATRAVDRWQSAAQWLERIMYS